MNTGDTITDLENLVEQVSSRLAGDEEKGPETRPTVNPPALPELICEECGDPAMVISKDFKLCADCAEEMRRNYVDDPGRLRPSERF